MKLSEIAAITGLPGLYKVTAHRSDGLIVTSLVDDKTQFVSGRNHLFTTLDSITIYTTDEPADLKSVFTSIRDKQKEHAVPDGKDDTQTKAWMEAVLPTYDKEKVYVSDMKKLAKWFRLLNDKNLIDELLAESEKEKTDENATEESPENKPKKTTSEKEDKVKKEAKPKSVKSTKATKGGTKPAPGAKKITAPRKAQ